MALVCFCTYCLPARAPTPAPCRMAGWGLLLTLCCLCWGDVVHSCNQRIHPSKGCPGPLLPSWGGSSAACPPAPVVYRCRTGLCSQLCPASASSWMLSQEVVGVPPKCHSQRQVLSLILTQEQLLPHSSAVWPQPQQRKCCFYFSNTDQAPWWQGGAGLESGKLLCCVLGYHRRARGRVVRGLGSVRSWVTNSHSFSISALERLGQQGLLWDGGVPLWTGGYKAQL